MGIAVPVTSQLGDGVRPGWWRRPAGCLPSGNAKMPVQRLFQWDCNALQTP